MVILPAIDIRNGMVVRLTQGDFERVNTYSDDPKMIAEKFLASGASNLHVVDLDGAQHGDSGNFGVIGEICSVKGLFTEVGGGIRDEKRICDYLELGVGRVILGTVAVENFDFTCEMIKKYGEKIAVGVDARNGMVAIRGWLSTTQIDSMEFCSRLDDAGISTIIYTDVLRDGTMEGISIEAYRRIQSIVSCNIVASGGISTMEEIKLLSEMNIYGAILGKSLYTGAIDLTACLKTASEHKSSDTR